MVMSDGITDCGRMVEHHRKNLNDKSRCESCVFWNVLFGCRHKNGDDYDLNGDCHWFRDELKESNDG